MTKDVYFVTVNEEDSYYAGETLQDLTEFIESYTAELQVGSEVLELSIYMKKMTQEEIDAIPEI